ncbi:SufE family protein [Candidatus Gracilibacteria bacterium]|nr:SufE family protein [Candidatus Gracilibacteria bacterium]
MHENEHIPPRLAEIIEEFAASDRSEKLELLLEFSDKLPPLPAHLAAHKGMQQVHECMTPVFVEAELVDGGLRYHFDIPPESPTTRGYAALLAEGLRGVAPHKVIAVPADFFQLMGLQQVLSPQRLNGASAILAYMKRLAVRYL